MATRIGDSLVRHARAGWRELRSRGARGAATYGLALLRQRLGVSSVAAATDTWTFTRWIEQAPIDGDLRVSVILPTYNRAALLPRAIASVRAQAHPGWELVVVDDGSSDDTPRVLAGFADERLRVVRVPNGGVCAARNHGLRAARGEVVAYLDDDNVMHPLWLKAVAWAFARRPEIDVVYGGFLVEDLLAVNGHAGGALPSFHLHPFDRAALAEQNLADISAVAHRRGLAEARFDETLRELGDWDLLRRLTRDKAPLVLPTIACFYYTSAGGRLSGGPSHESDAARVRARR